MDFRTATREERAADFIATATTIHDGRYDYRHVADQYVNGSTPVTIICPHHGSFRMPPSEHRRRTTKNQHAAQGCRDCAGRANASSEARGAKFLVKAAEHHGGRFDYSLMEFIDMKSPITVVCPTHGAFSQRPDNHIARGAVGCRQCSHDVSNAAHRKGDGQWTRRKSPARRREPKSA